MSRMENQIELKPCPFCGGKATMMHGAWTGTVMIRYFYMYYYGLCEKCGARAEANVDMGAAANAWNRRAGEPDDPLDAV